jgi:hypothetical protein
MTRRRIYVASSWRNMYQPMVVYELLAAGHEVYNFRHPTGPESDGFHWSEIDSAYKDWTPKQYRLALDAEIANNGFANDWNAMQWADTGVLVLPSGRSAHIEAGYFVGAHKDLYILVIDPMEPELMYKMATGICLSMYELVRSLVR